MNKDEQHYTELKNNIQTVNKITSVLLPIFVFLSIFFINIQKISSKELEDTTVLKGGKEKPDNIEIRNDKKCSFAIESTEIKKEVDKVTLKDLRKIINKYLEENGKSISELELEINELVKEVKHNKIEGNSGFWKSAYQSVKIYGKELFIAFFFCYSVYN